MMRKPMAISNWKMAMMVTESVAFVRDLDELAGDLLDKVDVVICPPFTALWAVAQTMRELGPFQLCGQNIAATSELARMGEISAALLADAGCSRVMLGHWELRRHLGDDDILVNRKVYQALEAGLSPILLVGEARDNTLPQKDALERQLSRVLADCQAEQVVATTFVYEPEGAIGVSAPASPEHVAAGCGHIRAWLCQRWGEAVAGCVRIIYGGSVDPEYAPALLSCPDVDGLGATRQGRNVMTFGNCAADCTREKQIRELRCHLFTWNC